MPDKALGPGDIVAGKYRVEQAIGSGGMGYVLGAIHISLGERVALKILHPAAAADGEAVARFFREARSASRIKGDHVVRVSDVGKLDDGTPYLVMEYLEGCDLSGLVERDGVLPVATAVDYVLQACEALGPIENILPTATEVFFIELGVGPSAINVDGGPVRRRRLHRRRRHHCQRPELRERPARDHVRCDLHLLGERGHARHRRQHHASRALI